MIVFLTSCGRPDLLQQTLNSFQKNNQHKNLKLIIHEDYDNYLSDLDLRGFESSTIRFTGQIGQHKSIEYFLKWAPQEKYYVHLEDDWLIENNSDWINHSIRIMEQFPDIIKVLCRKDSPHPCNHSVETIYLNEDKSETRFKWGRLQSWNNEGIIWRGFSWNPGVTRLDYLRKFIPFRLHEQDVAEEIWKKEFMVAELHNKIYSHIGFGRSTH